MANAAAGEGELSVAVCASDLATFHPYRIGDPNVRRILRHTWGTLTRLDEAGRAGPGLALKWTQSPDAKTWTFELRKASWSDGKPFTAEDVAFSIRALVNPPSFGAYGLAQVLGRGEGGAACRIVDPQTVQITLPQAEPEFPALAADIPILPEHLLGQVEKNGALFTAWGLETKNPATQIVTTGPYRIREYAKPQNGVFRLVLEANPGYWRVDAKGQKLPRIQKVSFLFGKDEAQTAALFAGGQAGQKADLVEDLTPELWEKLSGHAAPARKVETSAPRTFDLLVVNCFERGDSPVRFRMEDARRAFLSSEAFRKALSASIVRGQVAAALNAPGKIEPLAGLPWGAAEPSLKESAADAKSALQDASFKETQTGWKTPAGGAVEFRLLTDTGKIHQAMARELARQWGEFGFRVFVETVPAGAAVLRVLESGDFEVALVAVEAPAGAWSHRWRPLLDPRRHPLWGACDPARTPWLSALADAWSRIDESRSEEASAEASMLARSALEEGLPLIPLARRYGAALMTAPLEKETLRPAGCRGIATWNLEELGLKRQ